jgi:hypothetical protein
MTVGIVIEGDIRVTGSGSPVGVGTDAVIRRDAWTVGSAARLGVRIDIVIRRDAGNAPTLADVTIGVVVRRTVQTRWMRVPVNIPVEVIR